MLAKLTGAAAALTVAATFIVLAQLVKSGYFARSTTRRSVHDRLHEGTDATLMRKDKRSLIIQFLLLALVLSGVLAVLTYYGAPVPGLRNRVVAGLSGLVLGIPGAAAFVVKMSGPHTDDD